MSDHVTGFVHTLDTPRIEFIDRLTPRQAVLLHYMWGLAADAICGDSLTFDTRLRGLEAYSREMRAAPGGQRQSDLLAARISNLTNQMTAEEHAQLGVRVVRDAGAEMKCARCGCSDERACEGGCSWVSTDPPICSRCA